MLQQSSLHKPTGVVDQAEGLRALFKRRSTNSLVLAGAVPTALKMRWLFALAQWLSSQGQQVLILDETRGELSQVLGLPVRYDLLHVLEGDRQLAQVMQPLDSKVSMMSATKGLHAVSKMQRGFFHLQQAFAKLSNAPDCVLIYTAHEPSQVLASACAQHIETWLLADMQLDCFSQIQPYCRFLQTLGSRSLGLSFAAATTDRAQSIAQTQRVLSQDVARFYQLQLIYRGWLLSQSGAPTRSSWYPASSS